MNNQEKALPPLAPPLTVQQLPEALAHITDFGRKSRFTVSTRGTRKPQFSMYRCLRSPWYEEIIDGLLIVRVT